MSPDQLRTIFVGLRDLETIATRQGRWKNAPWKTWWRRWRDEPVMVYDLGEGWSMIPRRRVIGKGPAFDFMVNGIKVAAINQSQGEVTGEIFPQVILMVYNEKRQLHVIETVEDVERLPVNMLKFLMERLAERLQETS